MRREAQCRKSELLWLIKNLLVRIITLVLAMFKDRLFQSTCIRTRAELLADLGSLGAPAGVITEMSCNKYNCVIGSWLQRDYNRRDYGQMGVNKEDAYQRDFQQREYRDRPLAKSESHCFRCNDRNTNHWARECTLAKKNLWYCYVCCNVRTHKRSDCPNNIQMSDLSNNSKNYSSRNKCNGDPTDNNNLKIRVIKNKNARNSPCKNNGQTKAQSTVKRLPGLLYPHWKMTQLLAVLARMDATMGDVKGDYERRQDHLLRTESYFC
ncbi:hypothetical protein TKK_0012991 [Trichogramma kaykai]|uniref:CCHC-type domain-containing protein n=1 Tax=Trichogramma kaykai TaxID=54128 RepID=A0ABD2WKJ9_9HYME